MKIARYAVAALGLIAFLTPTAKADSFVYQVTSTSLNNLDVIFALPSFQEVVTTTTFTTATSFFGPIIEFQLSGNSTGCPLGGPKGQFGPCFVALTSETIVFGQGPPSVPSFTSPGTFTKTTFGTTTTVTITEVPTVPEPSSLALTPLGLVVLVVMRKRMGHSRPSTV